MFPICVNKHELHHPSKYQHSDVNMLQDETNAILTVVNAVWDGTGCYPHLNTFTCALLNPKCGADNHRLPPCRRMCEGEFTEPYLIWWFWSARHILFVRCCKVLTFIIIETGWNLWENVLKYKSTRASNMSSAPRPACWALMSMANPIEAPVEAAVCFYTMTWRLGRLYTGRQCTTEWVFTVILVIRPEGANHGLHRARITFLYAGNQSLWDLGLIVNLQQICLYVPTNYIGQ